MSCKQLVHDCIKFNNPSRLPIFYFNKDKEKSDIIKCGYMQDPGFIPSLESETEWGYTMRSLDGTIGQPQNGPLEKSLEDLKNYKIPDPEIPQRFELLKHTIEINPDKYIIANLGISGFGILTSIRGFANALMDIYLDHENIMTLFEKIIEFENAIIRQFCSIEGVDAVSFGDDWGSQAGLFINPADWRRIFKPYYKKQFDIIHQYGKTVYFHCCGKINDIIEDFIEIGVDVLNLNQPDLIGLEEMSEKYKGRVCFNCPVDHQTVAISGNDQEIRQYVRKLADALADKKGGYIAHIEEYHTIGMSDDNYKSICSAFEEIKYKVY